MNGEQTNPILVVPTLGNRPSLWPLLAGAGMDAVVVLTDDTEWWPADRSPNNPPITQATPFGQLYPELVSRHAVYWVKDTARPINIHRWWNRGIDVGASSAKNAAVVVNDDVEADPGALLMLADHVAQGASPAVLAYPDEPEHAAPRVTAITGYCFAINPRRIRPSESFSWWYGDNDLELRAERYPEGVERCTQLRGRIRHLRTDWSYDRPNEVAPLIEADRELFRQRYPDLGV